MKKDKHGRVMMGVKQTGCDDGQTNLIRDWDIPEGKGRNYVLLEFNNFSYKEGVKGEILHSLCKLFNFLAI